MPNGRIPAIQDHWNNGKVVWESNAVLKYLVQRYDTERKFTFDDPDLEADINTCKFFINTSIHSFKLVNIGLFFQASHQGPYFGQLQWFSFYHEEEVSSAITRSVPVFD